MAIDSFISKKIREGFFILLIASALFLLISLISYDISDPGWSRVVMEPGVQNYAGYFGAWCADVLLYFFGVMAYLFPILVACSGILLFKPIDNSADNFKALWAMRTTGFVLIVFSGCGLLNMLITQQLPSMIPGPSGGILGSIITSALIPKFSTTGTSILLISFFLIGITIGTGISWGLVFESIGLISVSFAKFMHKKRNIKIAAVPIVKKIKDQSKTKVITKKAKIPKTPKLSLPSPKKITKSAVIYNSDLPSVDLLEEASEADPTLHYTPEVLEHISSEVEQKLADFGVEVKVVGVCPGPIITRFEMTLAPGLKVSKITGLAKDLARSLSVMSVRVVEIIPGKSVVGLEIPNKHREVVRLREVLESSTYQDQKSPLSLALGKDIAGHPIVVDLATMPHLLVAGTTGSGKSVAVNVMLLSLLYKTTAKDLRLILIDPKMLELAVYDGISHLLTPVVTDMSDAANALRWCVGEMERRYELMADLGVRNIDGYNKKVKEEKLPKIVVIIDEFADLMMVVGKKVEELITRIAQKARASGIHLILATQRPSVDVITGLIKANIPSRIAFQVASRIDSRTILDQQGAEQLLGYGDMLYLPVGKNIPERVHGAFVSDEEVHAVVNAIKKSSPAPDYVEEIASGTGSAIPGIDNITDSGESDPLYDEAVSIVTDTRKASISFLQRRLKIGYNRAARLIEEMEAAGIVSEMQSNGSREVLVLPAPKG